MIEAVLVTAGCLHDRRHHHPRVAGEAMSLTPSQRVVLIAAMAGRPIPANLPNGVRRSLIIRGLLTPRHEVTADGRTELEQERRP